MEGGGGEGEEVGQSGKGIARGDGERKWIIKEGELEGKKVGRGQESRKGGGEESGELWGRESRQGGGEESGGRRERGTFVTYIIIHSCTVESRAYTPRPRI